MVKRLPILCLMACACFCSTAQNDSSSRTSYRNRVLITSAANAVFWSGSYTALNQTWYKDYGRSSFHFFDDNAEWNQIDKAGHAWTAYSISRASARMWKWTGLKEHTAVIFGGATGMIYQSIIELEDAHSRQWGFSWGDMGANAFGSALFTVQQLTWKEQRIKIKFSYTPRSYAPELIARRNSLFGKSFAERILKDYNSQTYWLSANLHSFFPDVPLPVWLDISLGYGADGLLGARGNTWTDGDGKTVNYQQIPRIRRFWLAPDIDLTRIRTRSRFLHTAFFLLNSLKIPAPALQLTSRGKLSLHAVKF